MKKMNTSRQLGTYFVVTTLCLVIISSSIDGGLIKTTYGYGYGNSTNNSGSSVSDKKTESKDKKDHSSKKKKKKEKHLKNSQHIVRKGDLLIQSGTGFKKNSNILLYFSRPDGTFYPPMIVRTDNKGKFSVKYLVAKPVGTYKWYAVTPTTGRKSKVADYKIAG